ncbi:ATP-binding protein [Paenibacillus phoenicis]|uniref:histidine kinase n=1 Tax=Paenibacillus phoenicis TaxID=554117 RepID=A0ABU5PR28_9BACL|nr:MULTISPECIES: ATP-binding protein [Paenibacillus]EES74328.1 PAS domain S-box protein [Paenibacillus sp. oral taxon 786 str. D14]MCT2197253.1 ATP-binding protein [Paenibacillus sp. p3-SID1389]MEA3572420.1 ATP-binding protein [Paenibacillus phoenicis]
MDVVKEILLQVLIASLPAFLFPLTFEKTNCCWPHNNRSAEGHPYAVGLMYTCFTSMLLCDIFASRLWEVSPLNFGILPLFALMLYGRLRDGVTLALLQIILHPLFAVNYTLIGFIMETGILLYPFVLLTSRYFKRTGRQGKVAILSLYFMGGETMIGMSPFLTGSLSFHSDLNAITNGFINVLVTMLVGSLFVYMIESTLEKEKLRGQVMQLSREYFREAEKLQQMMDAAPLGIVLLDQQGYIISINETFLQLYRTYQKEPNESRREDLLLRRLSDVLSGVPIESIASRVEQSLEGQTKVTDLIKADNHIYFTSTSPIQKSKSNEVIGAVAIVQDITELETLRMELNHVERLSLVGQMAAGITHEIRNPMAVVRGFLQLMREKSPPTLDHYYRIVMEELDRANGIINDFLSLAQNRPVESEKCHLHDIIKELTPLLWADANLRGQTIEVKLDDSMPELLLNAKEIKQLILNLSRNAMEAMAEKGQLTLETRVTDQGGLLVVSDTGPGIPSGQREKLFEPFFTTKAKGTGLGLALCLSIVERHGGKITVDSTEGQGTTFTVLFPLS